MVVTNFILQLLPKLLSNVQLAGNLEGISVLG